MNPLTAREMTRAEKLQDYIHILCKAQESGHDVHKELKEALEDYRAEMNVESLKKKEIRVGLNQEVRLTISTDNGNEGDNEEVNTNGVRKIVLVYQ